jgi:hypothetical protein
VKYRKSTASKSHRETIARSTPGTHFGDPQRLAPAELWTPEVLVRDRVSPSIQFLQLLTASLRPRIVLDREQPQVHAVPGEVVRDVRRIRHSRNPDAGWS